MQKKKNLNKKLVNNIIFQFKINFKMKLNKI